jgi:two-component system, chemotaxis family, protein-glutamate methylesterase/glutaminase
MLPIESSLRPRRDGFNIAEDETSCVVFGMPREAIAHGAADEVPPLGAHRTAAHRVAARQRGHRHLAV